MGLCRPVPELDDTGCPATAPRSPRGLPCRARDCPRGCPVADGADSRPPWQAVSHQTRRGIDAGCFAAMAHDRREVLRGAAGRPPQPTGAMVDSASRQSTPESGQRAGDDGDTRRKGRTRHLAVDTLGHLLARPVTPATAQDREQVGRLAAAVQAVTGQAVALADVDQGDPGETAAAAAQDQGIRLEVVTLETAKCGFVLVPRRWVVERSFAWAARFRRLANDDERLPETIAGRHVFTCACLMLHQRVPVIAQRP